MVGSDRERPFERNHGILVPAEFRAASAASARDPGIAGPLGQDAAQVGSASAGGGT